MSRKKNLNRKSVASFFEPLEGRRFLSVGDLLPIGDTTGTAPTPLTETTIAQGNDTLVITGNTVKRDLPNGTTDTTFGTSGSVTLTFTPRAIGLTSGGQIIAAGLSGTSFKATRLTANGAVDNTYGTTGTGTVPLTSGDTYSGTEITINSSGDVTMITEGVAAGGVVQNVPTSAFVELARLNATGAVDTTYESAGVDTINGVVGVTFTVLPDGGLVMIGQAIPTGQPATVTGALFVNNSGTPTSLTVAEGLNSAIKTVRDTNGGYYLFGLHDSSYTLQHYNDAVLDTAFGSQGNVSLNRWLNYTNAGFATLTVSAVNGVSVESNGDILVQYQASVAGGVASAPVVAELNTNGSINTDFGTDGFILLSVGDTVFTPTGNSDLTVLSNGDFTISGEGANSTPVTDTFQGVDRAVNPAVSSIDFSAATGEKYAYVTVEFAAGQTALTSADIEAHSLIVISSTGIQVTANISSATGGSGSPLDVTYAFRIDRRSLLRHDNGVYQFMELGDAAVDSLGRGSAGGMAEYSLYIAPQNRGGPVLTEVIGPSVSAANLQPQIQQTADDVAAQDYSVLND